MRAFGRLQLTYTPQDLSNLQGSPKMHDCCMSKAFKFSPVFFSAVGLAKLCTYFWVGRLTLDLGSFIQGG